MILGLFCLPLFFWPTWDSSFVQPKEILLSLSALTAIVWGGYLLIKGEVANFKLKKVPLLMIVLALFSFYALLRTLGSDSVVAAIFGTYNRGLGLFSYLNLAILAIYTILFLEKDDLALLSKCSYFSGLVLAIYGVGQKFGLDPFFSHFGKEIFEGRVFSFLGNPGYLASFLVIQFLMGFWLISVYKKLAKRLFIFAQILLFVAIIFTETRTALIGLVLAGLMIILKYRHKLWDGARKLGSKKILASLILVVALVAGVYLVAPERFSLGNLAGRSLGSRVEIWKSSFSAIAKSPIVGHGLNNLYIHSPEFTSKEFYQLEENYFLTIDRLHNETLEVLYGFGLVGLAFYLAIFVLLVKTFWTSKNTYQSTLALASVIYLIQNQLSFPDLSILVWFVISLASLIKLSWSEDKHRESDVMVRAAITVTVSIALIMLQMGYYSVPLLWGNAYYSEAKQTLLKNYNDGIVLYKEALNNFPYFSDWWYYFMQIDKLNITRGLEAVEAIEGESGTLNAWKGNYYAENDFEKAANYYQKAIDSNPYNPTWVKAYADFLYKVGDLPNALFLYDKFLESIPEYWQWQNLDQMSPEKQKSYRIFFKNSPDLVKTLERIEEINKQLK